MKFPSTITFVKLSANVESDYAEQRGTEWVLMRAMSGARTTLDYMEASVGRCVEDAFGERVYRYLKSVTRTDTLRRWRAMTGGRVQWAEDRQEKTDATRREKRWAALPHLHTPWRSSAVRRRRPRPPPPSTAAARADAVGSLCRRAARERRATREAARWPPAAQPPRGGGRQGAGGGGAHPAGGGPAAGEHRAVRTQRAGRRTAAYRSTMPGAGPRPIQPRARAGMRHRQPPPRGGRR